MRYEFIGNEDGAATAFLKAGFVGIRGDVVPVSKLSVVDIVNSAGEILRVTNSMIGAGERDEVGQLQFEWLAAPLQDGLYEDLGDRFSDANRISVLELSTLGITAQSGVVIANSSGDKLIIVSSVMPTLVEVSGAFSDLGRFSPEYDLHEYDEILLA